MRGFFANAFIEQNYVRKILVRILQKIYKFGDWQLQLIDERPYALEVVHRCNKYLLGIEKPIVVEVGAGIGEIIQNISKNKAGKYAYDINFRNIKASRIMNPGINYQKGTFEDVKIGKIDCFIMVNFIHLLSEEILSEQIKAVLQKNDVSLFVMDTFNNNENTCYTYSHDGNKLFDDEYYLQYKSRGFQASGDARRYIEYWVKKSD